MHLIPNIIFIILTGVAIFFFAKNIQKIRRNILLGRDLNISGHITDRIKMMLRVAFGQSKMGTRPLAAVLHFFVYAGFLIINLEVLEIMIDGVFGTHRVFAFLGGFYSFLIASFEILALLTWVACVVFLIRRNIVHVKRLLGREMTAWPRSDANYILITEVLLMTAFLTMNACDYLLQMAGHEHYIQAGMFPISSYWAALFSGS
jgi:hypothetical protein